jgi:menaquinone-dependent protoporphyrinogen oxidase
MDFAARWVRKDVALILVARLSVGFDDVEMIAGALRYSKYSLPLKWIMRRIAASAGEKTQTFRDYEYTAWHQVEQYPMRLSGRL